MTDMLDRAMVVAVATGLGLGLAPKSQTEPPRADTTRLGVQQLAYVAYPMWWAEHPGPCPPALASLTGYTMMKSMIDAWGQQLVARCNPTGGLYVGSLGPDGRADTDDDIWSAPPSAASVAIPTEAML